MFLGCPELAWRRKMAGHFSYLTLRQSSTIPKNTDARFPKSFNAHQWIRRAQFSQAEVIQKREPAPIKSQQTAVQAAEKDKCCLSGVHPVAVIAWKASSFVPDGWTKSCLRQTTAERRMSLATREHKAVVTDFCVCRALWFFHAMKERIKIRLNKEKLTGHRGVWSKLKPILHTPQ